MNLTIEDAQRTLLEKGIIISNAAEFDLNTPISFSISLDGLEGTGKTHFIMFTMPRPLVVVNFGDRSANQFLYRMTDEEREGVYTYDIQPSSPEGWTFAEAVKSLVTLNTIIAEMAPSMPGGTFALDGGTSWWSVMQQVFVEPKEKERMVAGKKQVGGIIYEEANNRVRGVYGHIKSNGCFLVMTHQMKQDWDKDGPVVGSFSPKKNSQIQYLAEAEVTLMKFCLQCQGFACEKEGHMGRKYVGRIKKLSGPSGKALEGIQIENLTFPVLYKLQTGKTFPNPELLRGEARTAVEAELAKEQEKKNANPN